MENVFVDVSELTATFKYFFIYMIQFFNSIYIKFFDNYYSAFYILITILAVSIVFQLWGSDNDD